MDMKLLHRSRANRIQRQSLFVRVIIPLSKVEGIPIFPRVVGHFQNSGKRVCIGYERLILGQQYPARRAVFRDRIGGYTLGSLEAELKAVAKGGIPYAASFAVPVLGSASDGTLRGLAVSAPLFYFIRTGEATFNCGAIIFVALTDAAGYIFAANVIKGTVGGGGLCNG